LAVKAATDNPLKSLKPNNMIKNYLKIAWRNLAKERMSSVINICGLAAGLVVTLLIALWITDELQYNKGFQHYDRIAQVFQHQTENGNVGTYQGLPFPLGKELQTNYGENFKYVVMSSWGYDLIVSAGDKNLSGHGAYMDVAAPHMLSLEMLEGTREGLRDPHSFLLSASLAKAFFGDADPMNRMMRIGQKLDVKVTGVYKDMPYNSDFGNLAFIAPWDLYATSEDWLKRANTQWDNNSFQTYVQIADNTDFATVDKRIADAKQKNVADIDKKYHTRLFLHPMSEWRLHSKWENGVQTGGLIEYVRPVSIS
jgi:hypothetical protein